MKVGIFLDFCYPGEVRNAYQRYLGAVEQVQLAEEVGFDEAFFAEHHFLDNGWEIMPNPLIFAHDIARRTKRMTIGPASVILTQWNPIRLAEDIAVTDLLTDGRLRVGLGRGYRFTELAGWGVSTKEHENRELFEESLEIILKAWTEDYLTHKGPNYEYPGPEYPERDKGIMVVPKPLQKPHPPLFMTVFQKSTLESAARRGYGVVLAIIPNPVLREYVRAYYDAARSAGHDVELGEKVTIARVCYVADSDRQARQDIEVHLKTFWRMAGPQVARGLPAGMVEPDADGGFSPPFETLQNINVIAGTPGHCLEQFHRLKEETGVGTVWLAPDITNLDHEKTMQNIRNIGKILPEIQAL